MSYNYLPLDRKQLHFQQVKNLLDYNQLVSITFDAHERILRCREYLDNTSTHINEQIQRNDQSLCNVLKGTAVGTGEEVEADIIKLMLMLKIKSLSYGHSGVQIETVKRLMEMFNTEVLPVIYSQGLSAAGGECGALSHLSMPLVGLGEVYYKGQKSAASSVLAKLDWQPINLQSNEVAALVTGTHFTSAYGMYALKKTEQLLKIADIIAALSFDVFDCSVMSLHEKIHSIPSHKGQVNTAAAILNYLGGSEAASERKEPSNETFSFSCTPQVHGAAKDTFEYVLNVFLREINSVTESPIIYPEENLVLTVGNFNGQHLSLTLDYLAIAMTGLGNISVRRTKQIDIDQRNLAAYAPGFSSLQSATAAIASENKRLSTPASVGNISSGDSHEDFISTGVNAATKCLRVINNVEKVLAIELLVAAKAREFKKSTESPPFLKQLVADFRQQVVSVDEFSILPDDIIKAVEFISNIKLRNSNL